MAAVTSGLSAFNLDVDSIIEMAVEPSGGEHVSAEEAEKARRVLNLLLIEMQNKNIPLSKLDFENVTLTAGIPTYTLNTNILKVLQGTLSLAGTDIEMDGLSMQRYHIIPNKTTQMRPNSYMVQHTVSGPEITFWPVPDTPSNGPYIAKLFVSRKIEDVAASYQKVDLQPKYLPLLIAWFQYKLSLTRKNTTEEIRTRLQAEYLRMYNDTVENDHEDVDMMVVPGGIDGT